VQYRLLRLLAGSQQGNSTARVVAVGDPDQSVYGWRGADAQVPPPPPPRTIRTRRVPHPVLIGHAASLTPY